ncbi:MAG TPA: class II aldolase/adducin family protein [Desulfurococcales archaeon]|nr:class II aldolase/adducin family protein [Desulfurococcales archaeon]
METCVEEELKRNICYVMRLLYERGLVSALSGNVSARLPGAREFWITPSGLFKGMIKPSDLVKIDLNGNITSGNRKPSIETPLHTAIYRSRHDINAIVHSHNPYTIGLILAGVELKPITVEGALILKKTTIIPYAPPGSSKLVQLVSKEVSKGYNILILKHHGVIAASTDLFKALALVEMLEELAKTQFICRVLGREPSTIPELDIL